MDYELRHGEPVDEMVRRLCREQVDRVERTLTDADVDVHDGVHEARKAFKRIRAAIRLVRPSLGDSYPLENAWYRDRARALSPVRDATALVATVDELGEIFSGQRDHAFVDRARTALLKRREDLAAREGGVRRLLDSLVDDLGDARERITGWTLDTDGFEAVGPGLAKTYGRGRSAVTAAYGAPSGDKVHELRKRAKYHRLHTQVLVPLWPDLLKPRLKAAHRLTDLLGDHQDLQVLRSTLRDEPHLLDQPRDTQVLVGAVDRRQAELRAEAEPLARRIFAETPKAAAARFGAFWEVWSQG